MWHVPVMPAIAWLQMNCKPMEKTGRQSMCLWKANGRGVFIHRGRSKEAWVDHRAARSIMDDAYGACKDKRPGHSSVQVDPEVVAKLDEVRKMKGMTPRAVSDEDSGSLDEIRSIKVFKVSSRLFDCLTFPPVAESAAG